MRSSELIPTTQLNLKEARPDARPQLQQRVFTNIYVTCAFSKTHYDVRERFLLVQNIQPADEGRGTRGFTQASATSCSGTWWTSPARTKSTRLSRTPSASSASSSTQIKLFLAWYVSYFELFV